MGQTQSCLGRLVSWAPFQLQASMIFLWRQNECLLKILALVSLYVFSTVNLFLSFKSIYQFCQITKLTHAYFKRIQKKCEKFPPTPIILLRIKVSSTEVSFQAFFCVCMNAFYEYIYPEDICIQDICVCMHVCVCIYTYTHIHVHIHTHTHISNCINACGWA